jgi:hypothetical protein
VGVGKRLTYVKIDDILTPYLKDIDSLVMLRTDNIHLWEIMNQNRNCNKKLNSDVTVVLDNTVAAHMINIETPLWSVKLKCSDSRIKRPYHVFNMIDENNVDDVKAIAATLYALYNLTKGA